VAEAVTKDKVTTHYMTDNKEFLQDHDWHTTEPMLQSRTHVTPVPYRSSWRCTCEASTLSNGRQIALPRRDLRRSYPICTARLGAPSGDAPPTPGALTVREAARPDDRRFGSPRAQRGSENVTREPARDSWASVSAASFTAGSLCATVVVWSAQLRSANYATTTPKLFARWKAATLLSLRAMAFRSGV
jgi:hypothetical protein